MNTNPDINESKYIQAVCIFLDATVKYFDLDSTLAERKTPEQSREVALAAIKTIKEILVRTEKLMKIKLKFAELKIDETALQELAGKPLKEIDDADIDRLRQIYQDKTRWA